MLGSFLKETPFLLLKSAYEKAKPTLFFIFYRFSFLWNVPVLWNLLWTHSEKKNLSTLLIYLILFQSSTHFVFLVIPIYFLIVMEFFFQLSSAKVIKSSQDGTYLLILCFSLSLHILILYQWLLASLKHVHPLITESDQNMKIFRKSKGYSLNFKLLLLVLSEPLEGISQFLIGYSLLLKVSRRLLYVQVNQLGKPVT
jgi:hypothetical protein